MSNSKSIQTIDKSNIVELKEELYSRKRDLVSIKIHTTLKQDPVVMKKAKDLKKECQKISMFISAIEKVQKVNVSLNNSKAKQINKKVK
jgi:hypothetical protein